MERSVAKKYWKVTPRLYFSPSKNVSYQCSSIVPAIAGYVGHYVVKRQRMLHIIEFLQEINALVAGKVTVSLGIGQAEALSEITDNGYDI